MKKSDSDGLFKKRGFYVALYSCLGLVLVVAAAISFGNLTAPKSDKTAINHTEQPEVKEVNQSSVESYLTEAAKLGMANVTPEVTSVPTPVSTAKPVISNTTVTQAPKVTEKPNNSVKKEVVEQKKPKDTPAKEKEEQGSNDEPVFSPFTDNSRMQWPVLGDIVMDYSVEHVIYDKTLDQFRTNDNVCIGAPVGTQVKAAASGVVTDIKKTSEKGNEIVIEHGNGWKTTYSQLQDNVLVKKGDVVQTGQVIGGVGRPTNYGVLLGNHVSFSVTKNDATINPREIVKK